MPAAPPPPHLPLPVEPSTRRFALPVSSTFATPVRAGPGRARGRGRAATTLAVVAAFVSALTSGCTGGGTSSPVPAPEGGAALPATITATVDGDTVDLRFADGHEDRARLLGIDTPETVKPDSPVDCFGPEASARTKALLPDGTAVLVQRDEESRDRYGRLLLYVWRQVDGLFVNRSLVADGYARTLSISPNTAREVDLSAAAAQARAAGRGLWGACPADG